MCAHASSLLLLILSYMSEKSLLIIVTEVFGSEANEASVSVSDFIIAEYSKDTMDDQYGYLI